MNKSILLSISILFSTTMVFAQTTGEEFYNLGLKQEKEGLLPEANDSFDKALKTDKKSVKYLLARAHVRELRQKYDAAIYDYTTVLKLDKNNKKAFYSRGHCFSVHGDFKQALEDFWKAIELDPTYEEAYIDMAVTNVLHHDEKEAAHDLDLLIEKVPAYKDVQFKKGVDKMRAGDVNAACGEWSKVAIASKPKADHLKQVFCH